ncbi:MAG TPA: ABC transporter permease [Bryobacteraceae bacterium]|nr:ABC transporter permease [Bryobacteraceae bacterium]
MNSIAFIDAIRQDTVFAARNLRKSLSFTAATVLALALGIGANTAIFTLFYNVHLRPLPYRNATELLSIGRELRGVPGGLAAVPEFLGWRLETHVIEKMTTWNAEEFNLTGSEMPERIQGADVTADFLPVLGVEPSLGHGFTAEDDKPGAVAVALLTHSLWQRRFGGNPSILGQTIVMNGAPYRIVGVLPAGFRFPGDIRTEVLVPSRLPVRPVWGGRGLVLTDVIALPKPGVTSEQVVAEFSSISARYQTQMPRFYMNPAHPSRITAVQLQEQLVGSGRPALFALMLSVATLLLIACLNVANLQLARATVRRPEIALRVALGASRARLAQWLVTENIVLSGAAGLVGIATAYALLAVLRASQLSLFQDPHAFDGGWILWVVTLGTSLAAGFVAASFPALTAPRFQVNDVLKTGVASVLGGRGSGVRSALVLVQVALALVLLIGSNLLLRSLQRVLAVNWGFRPERLLTLQMKLPESKYDTPSKQAAFVEELLTRVNGLPGVASAATSSSLPLVGYMGTATFQFEGQPAVPPVQRPGGPILIITPSYFQTMGTAILAGRPFSPSDHPETEGVAIVNAAFARKFYPGGDALGKRIQWGGNQEYTTIVGICDDMRQTGRESRVDTELYLPVAQNPVRPVNLIIRTKTAPSTLASAARSAIWATDKNQAIYSVVTMDDLIRRFGANRRIETLLLSFLGVLATALAAIGIYGVVAETISQRTGEIGLRMALGARTGDILRMVLRRSLVLALGGVVVGTCAGLYVVRYLQSLVFGVDLKDAVAFGSAGGFLLIVATVAAYIPARRSASIDPTSTLRSQ